MFDTIIRHYHFDSVVLKRIMEKLSLIAHQGDTIMATIENVQEAIAAEKLQVTTALEALKAQVADLQAQVAAGSAATPEQLDALIVAIDAVYTPAPEVVPAE